MPRSRETRVFDLATELRERRDDGSRSFVGHASVFDKLSAELWGFYERVAPGAFERATDGKDDVRFLINHDPNLLLARSKFGEGTLKLAADEVGLRTEADLNLEQTYTRDLAVAMDRGDIDQMSFGFRVLQDSWDREQLETEEGEIEIVVRTVEKVELFDVSVVTFPAYPATDAELNGVALRYLGLAPAWSRNAPNATTNIVIAPPTVELTATAERSLDEQLADVARTIEGLNELREGVELSQENRNLVERIVRGLGAFVTPFEEEAASAIEGGGDDDDPTRGAQLPAFGLMRRRLDLLDRDLTP